MDDDGPAALANGPPHGRDHEDVIGARRQQAAHQKPQHPAEENKDREAHAGRTHDGGIAGHDETQIKQDAGCHARGARHQVRSH
jgi:hypothetical protein